MKEIWNGRGAESCGQCCCFLALTAPKVDRVGAAEGKHRLNAHRGMDLPAGQFPDEKGVDGAKQHLTVSGTGPRAV